jgi:hypothetical protein
VKIGLAALTLLAVTLGTVGGATLLVERRLSTLAPGGVQVEKLAYNHIFIGTSFG